jgi:hypothetical protein
MKYSSSFTYDLHIGEQSESWVKDLIGNAKIEVKGDSAAHLTGNAFIEVYYKNKPSGISTTTADYWIYRIEATGSALIVSVDRLKMLIKKHHAINGYKKGGDNDNSIGVLVPLIEFLK